MVSKNNAYLKEVMHSHRVPHYGLRKLGIGVTSVLLGTTLYFGANAPVHADVTPATNGNGTNTGANVTPNSAVNNVESGRSVTLGQTNNSMSAPTSTTATSSTANQATANQNSGSVVSAQVTVQNSARVATPSQANVKASSAVGQSSNYQTVDVSQLGKMIQNPVSGGTVASSATNSSVTNSNISLTDSKIQKYTETVASQQMYSFH